MKKKPPLILCIVMDIIGYGTYVLPVMGEFGDIIWAPISAFVFYWTFGGRVGIIGGAFNFIEEIMPGLDFIPTFTIAWLWQYRSGQRSLEKE
ncbi:MAG TPA: hypothetical protein VNW06_12610 [Cytophagaceae bacterium]|nr:hypothetical protein [Cytophagaceae bacterium]